eukprot:gene23999-29118_t
MLIQYLPKLKPKKIVLASASPRRSELLRGLGLSIEIVPSTFDEKLDKSSFASGADYAKETATHKAIEVAGKTAGPDLVVGADTVVELNGEVLEKPDGFEGAFKMLRGLSGSKHKVHTGVVLVLPKAVDPATGKSPMVHSFSETTHVEFAELSDE